MVDGSVGFGNGTIINGVVYSRGSMSFGNNSTPAGVLASAGNISFSQNASLNHVPEAVTPQLLSGLCETASTGPLPVFDDFEGYPPGSISGLNGGTGWGGSWQGADGQSVVDTSGNPLLFQASNGLSIRSETTLEVDGNNARVATRPLSSTFTGDQIYLSMLVRFQGTPGNNDFLGFWLQQPGFGDSPQFGVKVNEGGGGDADFFVRLDTNAAYSTEFQPGQTYLLVARFDKDGSNYYNRGRLWVDPQCTDAPPPTPSATISRNPNNRVTQISELGFRSENLGGGAAIQVGQVAAGELWTDVVQCTCFQNGLEATFYNNYQSSDPFPDNPVLTRLDPEVDFNWGGGSPDPAVNNNDFAAQWQGAIEVPESGNYRFRTRTDDGVRLWVDDLAFDQAIIDDWNDQSASNNTSDAIFLEAGRRYAIRMQFYENGGQAVAELQWQTPRGGGFNIIPEANLFACLPVAAPLLESADAVCGASDILRVRFDQTPRSRVLDEASAETPAFYTVEELDSGNTITVDSATLEPGGYSVLLDLASNLASDESYRVTVTDVQDVGGLVMSPNPASVEFEGGGTGLTTFYWNNVDLSGPTVAQQNSADINENYGGGSPIPGVVNNDRFSIRWSGFIVAPATGNYRFQTRTDDGVRLWVQDLDNPIINQWVDQPPTTHESGVISLQQGQSYALRMEMYENRGGAVAELRWDTPQTSGFEIVPASALFNCPDAGNELDHFRIISGGNAVTCTPAPVTIQASDANGQPVTDYAGTISLSTSTGQGDWFAGAGANGSLNRGPGNSGQASYGFVPADNGVVTLDLRHTLAATVNVDVADGSVTELSGFDPDILFAETGFLFHQAGDLSSSIGSLVAGRDSTLNPGGQSLRLTAVRTNDNTGACEAFLTGPQAVEIGYVCDNPANCALTDALQINGQTVASNNSGSTANSSSLSLDFGDDTTSSAPLVLNYRDAGRISLFASRPLTDAEGNPTGGEIAGTSNAFVSVPAGFCIAATDTSAECTGDPATCSVLTTAGSDFQVRYQAVAWQQAGETGAQFCAGNPVTPGFARLNLDLTHELVAPTGGEAGNFTPAQVSFGTGAGGVSDQLQQISEVGAFRVRIPAGQSYLGEALPEAASAVVGRFIPARFVVSLADAGEFAPECTGTPDFTYTGQDFGWQVPPSVLISAQSEQGDVTTNYTRGDFRKLQAADVGRDLPDTDSNQQEQGSTDLLDVTMTAQPAGLTTAAPGQISYQFSASDSLVYPKTAVSQVPPFSPSLSFAISAVMDSDGVTGAASLPLSFVPAANLEVRYGRWFMENVYGPENIAALPMPFQAQYWTGSRFELNEADDCSTWNTVDISGTTNHHSLVAASGTLNGGTGGPLSLQPTGSQGTDTLVWQQPVWLQHFWNDAATLQNPSALATFGVYRGHDRVIYWRERL
ncbi:MAG: DUF6701 domain-containing protein [Marinobacter sp.]|uniref:DUF6701 domain-containing protein n=1 Tax=Marinobacter sp. TaxID=50741 RepID=UPI00299CE8A3|nr:DUF6701 domain-containing protein [Marinobacter sp.]MDX1635344.1 DUF6701 domain-containing protein [Marinobacter sp.]